MIFLTFFSPRLSFFFFLFFFLTFSILCRMVRCALLVPLGKE